jgi:flagellar basal body P-ring formation protein FlgA
MTRLTPLTKPSHRVVFAAVACLGVLTLAVASARAQSSLETVSSLRLKPIVTVETDVVRLGDLIEGAGSQSGVAVFSSPQPGTSGMISAARIVGAAKENGMGTIETNGLSSIAVRRLGRRVSVEEITRAITTALINEHQLSKDTELELNAGQLETTVESSATDPVLVRHLSYNGGSGRFEATFVVPGSRSMELNPGKVVGNIADIVRVPVLTKAILKGDVVTAGDISIERRRRSDMGADVFTDTSKVIGNVARRPLPRGLVLREADIQRLDAVERNANVTMVFEQPGLQLSMRGKATQSGAIGDIIQVQNINSKKMVEAIVTGPGRVSVTGVVLPQKTARNGSSNNN